MKLLATLNFMKNYNLSVVILIAVFAIFFNTGLSAADYYWVNGTGSWKDYSNHWATTSGGSTYYSQVPGVNDNVFFDNNSFPLPGAVVTVDTTANCNNINWTGAQNIPDLAGWNQIYIYGSLTFIPNMTATYNGQLYFASSNPGNTVNFSTVPLMINNIQFDGQGEWTLLSDIDLTLVGFGQLIVSEGTLNTNGKTISVGMFNSWPMGVRTINLGNSTINCQNLMLMNPASLTLNAGTSTINLRNGWFNGEGLTYYDVNFVPTWATEVNIMSSNTFHTVGLVDTNVLGVVFPSGNMQTIYDIDFGATCYNRKSVRAMNAGEAAIIKKLTGTVQEDFLSIKDITIIGGAAFITDNGIDLGNVTNWTINPSAPATYYWVGGTGNWSDPGHWSLSSGGPYPSGNTCVPSDADDVIFDVNSFSLAGQTVTIDVYAYCKNMTWLGVLFNPTLASSFPSQLNIFGSLTLDPGMTYSYTSYIYFKSPVFGNTIFTAGKTFSSYLYFEGAGEWTFLDALNGTSYVYLNQGSLNSGNQTLNMNSFTSGTTLSRQLILGNSTINCSWGWYITDSTNLTFDAGNSIINLNSGTFNGGSQIYNNVIFNSTTSTYIYGTNTFNNLVNLSAGDLYFEAGTTQTFNTFATNGSCSDLCKIYSTVAGQAATLSKPAGGVAVSYVVIKDNIAAGGAIFNANNSVDEGNVSGWNFTLLASKNYYWIGGAGNWNDPANWSESSGGPANPGGCIPTQVDNVFFDNNSGLGGQAVTINATANCNNMNWTGVSPNAILTGASYAINIYGSLTLVANVTLNHIGNIYFVSNNPGNTINMANKTYYGHIYFNGSGNWTLQSTLITSIVNNKSIYFTKGNLITNNFNITTYYFYSYQPYWRQLDLGSSTLTVTYWYIYDGTGYTVNPGTSVINTTSSSFYGGSASYNNVNISAASYVYIMGSNSFNTLNASNCTGLYFEGGSTTTFNTLTIPDGTGCTNYFYIGTNNSGNVAHLLKPAGFFIKNWLLINDLTAGGGAVFTALSSQGVGDVTGWNILSPSGVNLYWIADGGDWSDVNHWSLSSGGAPYGCPPTAEDNVFFDANSFSLPGQEVNINANAYCKNMNWTGVTNIPNLTGWSQLNINGSLTLNIAMTIDYWGTYNFTSPLPANTITTTGHTISNLRFSGLGEYSLLDPINMTWGSIYFNSGTFNTNNNDIITDGQFVSNSSSIRVLNLGSSHITVDNWQIMDNTNLTINAGTSEIILTTSAWEFRGGDMTYNNLTVNSNQWGSPVTFYGSNTFNILNLLPGVILQLDTNTVQSTTNLTATGDQGSFITLKTNIDGITAEINQSSQDFCGDYLNIQDMVASGGVTFYAGENSVDLGNNTGWTWSGVIAIDQYPAAMCEDTPGGGTVAGIDLTALEDAIDGGNPYSHSWFEDAALTIPVADPSDVTVANNQIFYDEVDNSICTNIAEVIYTVSSKAILDFTVTDVSCNGLSNGAIELTVNSPFTPFTYIWSNGETVEDIDSLSPGTYSVTVTDAFNCSSVDSTSVSEPPVLTISVDSIINVSCGGASNGAVYCTTSGGIPPYTFAWTNTLQTTEDITSLGGNTYNVTVTDNNGCTVTDSAIVSEPTTVVITIDSTWNVTCGGANDGAVFTTTTGGSIPYAYLWSTGQTTDDITGLSGNTYYVTVSDASGCTDNDSSTVFESVGLNAGIASTDVSCYGLNDGTIDLTVNGGAFPYAYFWNTGQITEDLINLPAGSYFVTVTDAAGCTISDSAAIAEPPQIVSSVAETDETCSGSSDGAADLIVSGGVSPYTYLWSTGEITQDLTNITGGTYTVTITDNTGCTATETAVVLTLSAITTNITGTDVTCSGLDDGAADLTVAGGAAPYSFLWNTGATTEDLTNIPAGNYYVTVTDVLSCWTIDSVTINETSSLTSFMFVNNATCYDACDGSANVFVFGGTPPYTYLWSSGGNTNFETNLCIGEKYVTVTDVIGCILIDTATIGSFPQLISNIAYSGITCNGLCDGSATEAPTGVAPFSYVWDILVPGTQTFTGGATGAIADDNVFHDFNLTVSGLGNLDGVLYSLDQVCIDITHTRDQHMDINIIAPDGTNIVLSDDNGGNGDDYTNTCFSMTGPDGLITAGTAPFTGTYIPEGNLNLINNGQPGNGTWRLSIRDDQASFSGTLNDWSLTFNSLVGVTTPTVSGLCPGTYHITVTDGNSCTTVDSVTITEPALLTAVLNSTNVTCNSLCDGSATAVVSGGTTPYSYNWSEGSTTSSLTGLCADDYYITVTDDNGCIISDTAAISEPPLLVVSVATTDANCLLANGQAIATPNGGTLPYNYLWDDPLAQTDATASALFAGVYHVTVADAAGCTVVGTAIINNISGPTAAIDTFVNVTCFGACDGYTVVTATGGTLPYSGYVWSDGQTNDTASALCPAAYTVTVVDAVGCAGITSVTITEPAVLIANVTGTDVTCYGSTDGTITANASGGTSPYFYLWNTGCTDVACNVSTGAYYVTATDNNGCTTTDSITINEPAALTSSIVTVNVTCNGLSNGSADLSAGGGTAPYDFTWSNSESTEDISSVLAGNYYVTITDNNTCSLIDTATITEPAQIITLIAGTDVLCNGGNDGSSDLTVTGGIAPYNYLWSEGSITEDIAGLTAGMYYVTVTDVNGCQIGDSVSIFEPVAIITIIAPTDVNCYGLNDGFADLSVSGGTAPYDYIWSTGATTEDINSLIAGTYYITVSDVNNCSISDSVNIVQPDSLYFFGWGTTSVTCNGGNDGIASVVAAGGTGTYSYLWNTIPGQTTSSATGLSAGDYTVTVTDENNCTIEKTITVGQPAALTANIIITDISCYGGSDGSADLTVSGGNAPYIYVWSNNSTSEDLSNVISGIYFVTITDAQGCTLVDTTNIIEPSEIVIIISTVDANCGASDGQATATVSGGTAPYSYLWNDPLVQTTPTAINLSAGSYIVTVTDNNGCTSPDTAVVNNVGDLSASIGSVSDVACFGSCDGYTVVSVTGGTPPYTYLWDDALAQTTDTASNLCQGIYNVTVTDNLSCVDFASAVINEPAALSVSNTYTDITCYGAADGTVTANVLGGTFPYSYLWNMGCTDVACNVSTSATYNVTVTDINGCTANDSITITEPAVLIANVTGTDVTCYGSADGTITANTSGGTSPYFYLWNTGCTDLACNVSAGAYYVTATDNNGCTTTDSITINEPSQIITTVSTTDASCTIPDGTASVSVAGGTSPYSYLWNDPLSQTNDTVTGLLAGTYMVIITDAATCSAIDSAIVNNAAAVTATISSTNDVSCNGDCDGSAMVTVSGGTPPFSYLWDDPSAQTDNAAILLCAATYNVTVTDAAGCSDIASVTIIEPAALSVNYTSSDVSCYGGNDGSINITVSGGTVPYSYFWNTGAVTQNLASLPASEYILTVTDANGCTANDSITITEPPEMIVSVTGTDITCYGAADGTVTANVSGGTFPYSYLWNMGCTDIACNVSAGATYNVTVTDINGCIESGTTNVNEPSAIIINITTTDANCGSSDGEAVATVTGGTAPYGYQWDDPLTQTNDTASGLSAGIYNITVTDAAGCTATGTTMVNNTGGLSISVDSISDVTCNGACDGFVIISITGGTPPYTYVWDDPLSQTTDTANNLCAGTYNVTVTDNIGCIDIISAIITEPSAIVTSIAGTDVSCNSGADGAADLTVTGGSLPYTYLWNSGEITEDLTSISAGLYLVTVTDNNLCNAVDSVTITEPSVLINTMIGTDVSCNSGTDGSVDLNISGGTPPYTYTWNTGETTEDLFNIPAGSYFVTITDFNSCTSTLGLFINEPSSTTVIISTVDANCGAADGEATANVAGGTLPYSYLWNDPLAQTTATATGLFAGTYNVTITDGAGCTNVETATVNNAGGLTISISSTTDVSCNGLCDGEAVVTITGGTPPFTYMWDDPGAQTTDTASNLCAGTYNVTVTDNDGCIAFASATINEPPAISVISSVTDVSCNGGNDGAIDITVSDGTAPYLYIWNTGETAEDLLNMQAGSFYPTITDANFCSIVSAPIVIGEPVAITTSVSGIDVSCNSGSDGAVDLTVNGGTIPYVYLWNTGQSTQDLINIGFGLYMVTVTDDNGCTAIAWIVINQPSALSTTISTVDADCGMADGEASVSVSGGTPPYNYLWNTGASTDVLQGVSAGIYFVTVTDSNGCTATSNAVINNIGAPAINIDTLIDAICYGFCDGYAAISASGGTPPYSYDWSTGLSGFPIHPDLCAGTYLLTVTDASGCIAIENIIINQPDSIILTFTTTDDFGSGDGTATVSVSGGTTPYNYLWNDSLVQTTETAVSLAYGWYSVYVTDADNCIATDSVEVHLWVTISELKGTFDVKFYPNPVKELCYIKINSDKNSTAEINITDVIGKTMFNNQYYFYSGENLLTFNMKRHPQGVYFVEISINNKLFTTKLVKSE